MSRTRRPDYAKHKREPKPKPSRRDRKAEDRDIIDNALPDTELPPPERPTWRD